MRYKLHLDCTAQVQSRMVQYKIYLDITEQVHQVGTVQAQTRQYSTVTRLEWYKLPLDSKIKLHQVGTVQYCYTRFVPNTPQP